MFADRILFADTDTDWLTDWEISTHYSWLTEIKTYNTLGQNIQTVTQGSWSKSSVLEIRETQ